MRKLIILPILFFYYFCFAQNDVKVYPSSWWVGMKNPHLQLMVHGKNIGKSELDFSQKSNLGIRLDSIQKLKNPNYLFLNFTIGANVKPGKIVFSLILEIFHENFCSII